MGAAWVSKQMSGVTGRQPSPSPAQGGRSQQHRHCRQNDLPPIAVGRMGFQPALDWQEPDQARRRGQEQRAPPPLSAPRQARLAAA